MDKKIKQIGRLATIIFALGITGQVNAQSNYKELPLLTISAGDYAATKENKLSNYNAIGTGMLPDTACYDHKINLYDNSGRYSNSPLLNHLPNNTEVIVDLRFKRNSCIGTALIPKIK